MDRIIEFVFQHIHLLLLDSSIEIGAITIMMQKHNVCRITYYRVMTCNKSFWWRKLIRRLHTLALSYLDILCSPVLVCSLHSNCPLGLHINVYNRFKHIGPYLDGFLSVGNLYITVVKAKGLTECLSTFQCRGQLYPYPTLLQQCVVFIESTATAQVEQDVAIFYPHVHSNASTAARHRLRRILAWCCPSIICRLRHYIQSYNNKQQKRKKSFHHNIYNV